MAIQMKIKSDSKGDDMAWHSACYWALPLAVALIGCAPAEPIKQGEISLKLENISDSAVVLKLANGLDRVVRIRGARSLFRTVKVWPGATSTSCKVGSSSLVTSELAWPDRSLDNSGFVEISPGEHVKVSIPARLPPSPAGSLCILTLTLEDGTRVKTATFHPAGEAD